MGWNHQLVKHTSAEKIRFFFWGFTMIFGVHSPLNLGTVEAWWNGKRFDGFFGWIFVIFQLHFFWYLEGLEGALEKHEQVGWFFCFQLPISEKWRKKNDFCRDGFMDIPAVEIVDCFDFFPGTRARVVVSNMSFSPGSFGGEWLIHCWRAYFSDGLVGSTTN